MEFVNVAQRAFCGIEAQTPKGADRLGTNTEACIKTLYSAGTTSAMGSERGVIDAGRIQKCKGSTLSARSLVELAIEAPIS